MHIVRTLALINHAAADRGAGAESLPQWRERMQVGHDTFAAALELGARAGQLAFAFAGGYQAALRHLDASLPPATFAALLLSEGKRQRPDELLTTLTPAGDGKYRLDGEKSWVMGGAEVDRMLVVARHGVRADGRVQAAIVVLPAQASGILHSARGEATFLPALPHGRVRFEAVAVDAGMLLPGDGWTDHARPFRTHEDIHVSAAVAAHVAVQAVRRAWPQALLASLLACISRLQACAGMDVADAEAHVLLAGAERELQQCAAQVNDLVRQGDDDFARDWRANHLLVALAAPARAKRLEKALATLAQAVTR